MAKKIKADQSEDTKNSVEKKIIAKEKKATVKDEKVTVTKAKKTENLVENVKPKAPRSRKIAASKEKIVTVDDKIDKINNNSDNQSNEIAQNASKPQAKKAITKNVATKKEVLTEKIEKVKKSAENEIEEKSQIKKNPKEKVAKIENISMEEKSVENIENNKIKTKKIAKKDAIEKIEPQKKATVTEKISEKEKKATVNNETIEKKLEGPENSTKITAKRVKKVATEENKNNRKSRNKKGNQPQKEINDEKTNEIVSEKIVANEIVIDELKDAESKSGLSKSARRRARKKAKKLREQTEQVLVNTSDLAVNDATVAKNNSVKPKNEITNNNSKVNNEKRAQNNLKRNKILRPYRHIPGNIKENWRAANNSNNNNNKSNVSADFEEFYDKNAPPIPFVDLSKLKDEKKNVTVRNNIEIVPINPQRLLSSAEKKDPFFQNFYREIEKFLISEMLVENGSKVVIAVSGGVDSVVMLDVLANISDKYHFAVYVAHYNHNLRGDKSNRDEKFVKELAASYNIPYYWANGKVAQHAEKNGMSIEESARFLRYFFFERITRTVKADFLTTAHTIEDSAETFLMNLFRGTGLTGLSGIPSKRQFIKDVILIRPFLNISKQRLVEYAQKRNLKWNEDETNFQDKYTRNKIRNDLIPKLAKDYTPAIIDIINRSAKLIQGADSIIHDYVRTHLNSVISTVSNDIIAIKVPLFKTFHEFIRGEMLQTILMKYFRMLPPSMKIIDRILKLENSEVGAVCEISRTVYAIRDRQFIAIAKKTTPNKVNEKIEKIGKYQIGNMQFILKEIEPKEVEFSNNPNIEYFDLIKISETLNIRNWEQNDDFNPLGMVGTMKISDFISNEKIPILEKPNILVIATNKNEIIWVCKHRINEKFKVTRDTKKVLKIELKEKNK